MQPTSTQRSLTLGFLECHLASLGRHWGVIGRDREMSDSYPKLSRLSIPTLTLTGYSAGLPAKKLIFAGVKIYL